MEERAESTVTKKETTIPPEVLKGTTCTTKVEGTSCATTTKKEPFLKRKVETVAGLALIISVISFILTLFVNFTGISPVMLETDNRIDEVFAVAGGDYHVTSELKESLTSRRNTELKNTLETLNALKQDPTWKSNVQLEKAIKEVKSLIH